MLSKSVRLAAGQLVRLPSSLCPPDLPSVSFCLPSCFPSCWSLCPPSLPSFFLCLWSCLPSVIFCLISFLSPSCHCVRFVPSISLCLRSYLPSCGSLRPPCLPSCFPFCWSLRPFAFLSPFIASAYLPFAYGFVSLLLPFVSLLISLVVPLLVGHFVRLIFLLCFLSPPLACNPSHLSPSCSALQYYICLPALGCVSFTILYIII